jgi:MazG family protein
VTDRKTFSDLVKLIAQLRAPDGCPWDRAQTHVSLRPYVLEEAHEVIAAIDQGDPSSLADELGDLLLQVLLHSQIAVENGEFTIEDVIDGLVRKLIRRHPHVFAGAPSDLDSINRMWDEVKRKEGRSKAQLPTLLTARKLVDHLPSSPQEIEDSDYLDDEAQAGGMVLATIARVWGSGIDPEIALRKAILHFSDKPNEVKH